MFFSSIHDLYVRKTWIAYTGTRLLNAPFWVLHMLLPFLIVKELGATPWQIACLTSLRPIVSLFSWYWSVPLQQYRKRLISNIVWANILGHLPFLFVPFVTNAWYFVFASAIYMLFYRGVNPAWMEILKINIPEKSRQTLFAFGSAFYHIGGSILAIGIGWLLDEHSQAWYLLFPITAILALAATVIQIKLPIKWETNDELGQKPFQAFSLTKPWIDAWKLMQRRPDFAYFQIGFMLAGSGLMLWQPALPQFFFSTLKVNYKELSLAMTLCKSIGYTFALPFWTYAMSRLNIFAFSAIVTMIAALSPLGLIFAKWDLTWLYMAYLLYGVMQAGSEMSWNLSGPIFSRQENSLLYSGVNVMTVGLRGYIAPTLGVILCQLTNESFILLLGAGLCLGATWQMLSARKKLSLSFSC